MNEMCVTHNYLQLWFLRNLSRLVSRGDIRQIILSHVIRLGIKETDTEFNMKLILKLLLNCLCLLLENAELLENTRQRCLVHCLFFFFDLRLPKNFKRWSFYRTVMRSQLRVFHLNAFGRFSILHYTQSASGTQRCIKLITEVSEFFFYDKIFHWKNLLFDFYFVNFLAVKKG